MITELGASDRENLDLLVKYLGPNSSVRGPRTDKGYYNHLDSLRGKSPETNVSSMCTAVCGDGFLGRSYAQTILVPVYPAEQPENVILAYAIHNDQRKKTLGSPDLFDALNIMGNTKQFTVRSCFGVSKIASRQAANLVVHAVDRSWSIAVPSTIECSLPAEKSEIPTREVATHFCTEFVSPG